MEELKPRNYKTQWWHLEPEDFDHLDIVAEIERLVGMSLTKHGKSYNGPCPYALEHGCSSRNDAFVVWPDISATKSKRHFHCRRCDRSGNIIKLLMDLRGIDMPEACKLLDIGSPDVAKRVKPQRKENPDEKRRREWEEAQLNWLHKYTLAFQRYALSSPRALAYFAQRGIPLEVVEELELCYIPPFKDAEQAKQDKEKWSMRYWTDRILFPLPDGGFSGRALYLWEPGMDEDTHKQLLDGFNAKVEAHNKRMIEAYGKVEGRKHSKGLIPRYKVISPRNKFFREQVLESSDHATFVEGPFDACACYAAGIKDVIAVGTNKIDAKYIPARICDVTIALDGDEAGLETAASWSKLLRRKGIAVRNVVIPDDGMGTDWSERYRLHSADGLTLLLNKEPAPEPEPEIVVEYDLCGPCLDEDKEVQATRYRDDIGYCESHYLALCQDREPLTQEQVLSVGRRVAAAVFPEGCEVHIVPPGYTIEDRARELAEEKRERAEMMTCASTEEYWERTRKRLKGFTADVPPEFLERAKRPRSYPAPFPRYELVENPATGRRELKQVGMWSATIESPAMSA